MFRWTLILRKLFHPAPSIRKPIRRRFRPWLEVLEDRITPSVTWTVDLNTDNGGATGQSTGATSGDLRYCVENAGFGDTINISPGLQNTTIDLNSEIQLAQNITINGPALGIVGISGQNDNRLFEVKPNIDATINNLVLEDGTTHTRFRQ